MTHHDLENRLTPIYAYMCKARKLARAQGADMKAVSIAVEIEDAIVKMDVLARDLAMNFNEEICDACKTS
jgi:hypothetical protein